MTKISALSDIGTSVASNDTFVLVDVSDPTTPNKKIQQQNLFLIPDGSQGTPALRFLNDTDVGLYRPTTNALGLVTGGSERLRIDSSGRVGIGTSSPSYQLDLGGGTTVDRRIQLRRGSDDAAQNLRIGWNGLDMVRSNVTLASGIGSEFSFNQVFSDGTRGVLHIDSAGRVGVGTATPTAKLQVVDGSNAALYIGNADAGPQYNNYYLSAQHIFRSGAGTDYGRFDASGRLLVGTSTSRIVEDLLGNGPQGLIQIEATNSDAIMSIISAGTADAGRAGTLSLGRHRNSTVGGTPTIVQNGDTLGAICFAGGDGTDMRTKGASIAAQVDGTPGVDDMPGRLVFSTTADGASSPTERMRIDSSGRVMIPNGVSTSPEDNSGTNGITFACTTGSYAQFAKIAGSVAGFNRMTNDGTIIRLMQTGTEQGTISVSGTTVSYNGAHLSRWSQLSGIDPYDKTVRPEILRGTVMSNLDEMCDWTCPTSGDCQDNEQLNKTRISDVEGDRNVAGVFQSWDDDDDTWVNDFYLAMTGDFIIRIGAGVTVERGDLLMSAGNGTAKPQDDDIIRSKTVAKVTSTNVSCTYPDGSYCVPCVLMAC